MSNIFQVSEALLHIYRERSGDPAFWAEPLNALSNGSFVIAAAFALDLAIYKRALKPSTLALISLAAVIGCGSFLFHTLPSYPTMWLDIIPITLFQILFLWLISQKLLSCSGWVSAGIVIAVVGTSFLLMPIQQPLNGSLFYIPTLLAMLVFSALWAKRSTAEPYLLGGTACCFALAITARSIDLTVPWPIGTHFLWHLLNGIVVYTALRTWIIATLSNHVTSNKEVPRSSFALVRRLLKLAIALTMVLALAWAGHFGYLVWQLQNLFAPNWIVWNFTHMPELFDTNLIRRGSEAYELERKPQALPQENSFADNPKPPADEQANAIALLDTVFNFDGQTTTISDWIKGSGTIGLVVVADNQVAFEQYYQGNRADSQAVSWSIAKSFVSALIGFAVAEGKISLQDPVDQHVPLLKGSGFQGVSIQDVLEMSSGIDFSEDYADPDSGINQLGQQIFFGRSTNKWIAKLQKKPGLSGKEFDYISVNTQVLGMVLEAATGQKLSSYMQEKLWSRLGAEADALWLTDAHGTELGFCGLCMRTRDYARFGLLYLNQGRNLKGEQLLPSQWLHDSVTPRTDDLQPGRKLFQDKSGVPELGYAYQFWIPQGEEGEFMAIGVYGQFIYVNPARRVVIAKNSAYIDYKIDGERMEYESIEAFRAIARRVGSGDQVRTTRFAGRGPVDMVYRKKILHQTPKCDFR
jgi:CubicO group peptidase (beta-lactamase class C family)